MGGEDLAPAGIRSPHRPVRGKSLYRLSYREPTRNAVIAVSLGVKLHGLHGGETSELHITASSLHLLYVFIHLQSSRSAMLFVRRLGNCDQMNVYLCVHSAEQKSSSLKFRTSRSGSDVTYSGHISSRFIFPIFFTFLAFLYLPFITINHAAYILTH